MFFPEVIPFPGRNEQFLFLAVFSGAFNRRKRNSIYVTVTLLIVSVLILTVGLAATTRTQNVTVGGYYPGVIVSIEGGSSLVATDIRAVFLVLFSSVAVSGACSDFLLLIYIYSSHGTGLQLSGLGAGVN